MAPSLLLLRSVAKNELMAVVWDSILMLLPASLSIFLSPVSFCHSSPVSPGIAHPAANLVRWQPRKRHGSPGHAPSLPAPSPLPPPDSTAAAAVSSGV